METQERSWSPRSQADPLAVLWIAATATAATDLAASEQKASVLLSAVAMPSAKRPGVFSIPETPLRWLDLTPRQAGAMFTPVHRRVATVEHYGVTDSQAPVYYHILNMTTHPRQFG